MTFLNCGRKFFKMHQSSFNWNSWELTPHKLSILDYQLTYSCPPPETTSRNSRGRLLQMMMIIASDGIVWVGWMADADPNVKGMEWVSPSLIPSGILVEFHSKWHHRALPSRSANVDGGVGWCKWFCNWQVVCMGLELIASWRGAGCSLGCECNVVESLCYLCAISLNPVSLLHPI